MAKHLIQIGLGLIFLGMIIIFIAGLSGTEKGESKFAVGGIIGFIPFGFANNKRMLWFVLILTAMIFFFNVVMWMRG